MTNLEIETLLALMAEHDASDLYLTVDTTPMYRISGNIRAAGTEPLTPEDTEALALSILSDKQQRQFDEELELNIALHYGTLGRFRINLMRQKSSIAIVIRRIKLTIPTIDDLRLPPILKDIALTKRGLVLVVGATGSGKSTTLAAMIDHRNTTTAGHIITIEDPIEFLHCHKRSIVSQREVGLDTISFESALKNCLRQTPDVILLGEIRTKETMEAAITFAETGHLCLATLHSNNANQAMERIMNFFPIARHKQIYLQLSLNLRGIVSQRLVRTVDGGQTPAVEILLDSPRVKDLIYKEQIAELKEAMEKGSQLGMQTFDQSLYDLYTARFISLEEALRNADSANNVRLRVKLAEEAENFKEAEDSLAFAPSPTDQSKAAPLKLRIDS